MAKIQQVEAAVVSELGAAVKVGVHAAVAAIVSYVASRVLGSHNVLLTTVWSTPPVTAVLNYLHTRFL